jgi:DNA-directed RNA polymerase subunit K/omega
MKLKAVSRGPNINLEKCVENSGGNRFNLVIIATARARELARRQHRADKKVHLNAPVSALIDIQEGRIGKEYLKKI